MPVVPTQGRSLGIGLNGISDFSTELPFLDIFQSSRVWYGTQAQR
jgi:hypothetical protein